MGRNEIVLSTPNVMQVIQTDPQFQRRMEEEVHIFHQLVDQAVQLGRTDLLGVVCQQGDIPPGSVAVAVIRPELQVTHMVMLEHLNYSTAKLNYDTSA